MNYYYWELGMGDFAEAYSVGDASIDFDNYEKCPICGAAVSGGKWISPRRIQFDKKLKKKTFPDFVTALGCGSEIIVSDRFREAYIQMGLTGIIDWEEVDEIMLAKRDKTAKESIPKYYSIEVERIPLMLDRKVTKIAYGQLLRERAQCKLCNPEGRTYDFIQNMHFETSECKKYDVFKTYEMGDRMFFSKRFIEFCESTQMVNCQFFPIEECGAEVDEIFNSEELSDLFGSDIII